MRSPVATSNTITSPWIAGLAVLALAGVNVMSLVMAMRASSAGITNRLPPPGKACTRRSGTWTEVSASSARISAASAA